MKVLVESMELSWKKISKVKRKTKYANGQKAYKNVFKTG